MKIRKKSYGDCNMVGKNIEYLRKQNGIKQKDFIAKIQVLGCDMNPTSYSKLEGQLRSATDKEIYVISKILNVSMEELFLEHSDTLFRPQGATQYASLSKNHFKMFTPFL